MRTVTLPNNWRPRWYQKPLWRYLENGGKRAIYTWHRRAGKDDVPLHGTACAVFERTGTYWYLLPEAAQARKAIWTAINPHTGKRRIDEAFPLDVRANTQEQEMFIRFVNGSTWQVVGSDNYNSLVGSPPVGVVLSEWALANPSAWGYLMPILRENGGWAVFNSTPRGRNHHWRMMQAARTDPAWFCETLTIEDTKALTGDELADELKGYKAAYGPDMGQALFDQEYYCSFDAAILGSYYGRALAELEREGRIADFEPADAHVNTAWDLGIGDSTAIWWWQIAGREIRVLDYYEANGRSIPELAEVVKGKPWPRGVDFVPHDAKVRELGTGKTRVETMKACGLAPRLVPAHTVPDGINAVRQTLARMWFAERCRDGVELLKQYRADWDDVNRCFRDKPKHDFTSHGADAMRYLCMAWREIAAQPEPEPRRWVGVGASNSATLDDLWLQHERMRM
jgi:phage terminase large subunit